MVMRQAFAQGHHPVMTTYRCGTALAVDDGVAVEAVLGIIHAVPPGGGIPACGRPGDPPMTALDMPWPPPKNMGGRTQNA